MLSSSAQASLSGRFEAPSTASPSWRGGLFRKYSGAHRRPVLIYRFPNLYGKWCRPRYNSAVATFCDAIANGRPYTVNDPSVELELLYIDDLVDEMLSALLGQEHRCGYEGLERVDGDDFCYVPNTDVEVPGRDRLPAGLLPRQPRDAFRPRPFGGVLLQEALEHIPVLLRAGALRLRPFHRR